MRWLGIDFGEKRIGIAVGIDDAKVTTAKPNLTPTGTLRRDAEAIDALARTHEVDGIVVGVPFHAADAKMQRVCQRLAEEIRKLGWEVCEVDEAGTSLEAERNREGARQTVAQRRKWKDGEAARLILERFFGETA